jgi:hypothetical protein
LAVAESHLRQTPVHSFEHGMLKTPGEVITLGVTARRARRLPLRGRCKQGTRRIAAMMKIKVPYRIID